MTSGCANNLSLCCILSPLKDPSGITHTFYFVIAIGNVYIGSCSGHDSVRRERETKSTRACVHLSVCNRLLCHWYRLLIQAVQQRFFKFVYEKMCQIYVLKEIYLTTNKLLCQVLHSASNSGICWVDHVISTVSKAHLMFFNICQNLFDFLSYFRLLYYIIL